MKKIFCILLLIIFQGCSSSIKIKPEVALVDVTFSNITLFETSADVVVRIDNENPHPIVIDGASHNISLNGISIGKGVTDQRVEIPRLGSTTQRLTVRISNLSLVKNIQSIIDAKEYDYRVDSTLYLAGGLGLDTVKVTQTGHLAKFQ